MVDLFACFKITPPNSERNFNQMILTVFYFAFEVCVSDSMNTSIQWNSKKILLGS